MADADLARAALAGALLLLLLVVVAPGASVGVRRGRPALASLRARLVARLARARDRGLARLASRAATALLGSASALVAVAAPARAGGVPATPVVSLQPSDAAHRVTVGAAARPAATVVVHRGDTLWDIARRHLRPGASDAEVARAWPRWYAANRAVIGPDPGLIRPGQRLRVPDLRPTGTSASQHHRSPAAPATSFDPDRR